MMVEFNLPWLLSLEIQFSLSFKIARLVSLRASQSVSQSDGRTGSRVCRLFWKISPSFFFWLVASRVTLSMVGTDKRRKRKCRISISIKDCRLFLFSRLCEWLRELRAKKSLPTFEKNVFLVSFLKDPFKAAAAAPFSFLPAPLLEYFFELILSFAHSHACSVFFFH